MRVVTLMCLAVGGLLGMAGFDGAVLARGQNAPAAAPAQAPAAAPAQPAPAAPVVSAAGRNGGSTGIRGAEKRRRSYASCNRESHNRGLRGGARRRFLIRCKLGYERRRSAAPVQATQPPAPAQAPAKAVPPQPQQQQPAKRL